MTRHPGVVVSQTYSEISYIKVRRVDPGGGSSTWLGWLAYTKDPNDLVTYAGTEPRPPAPTVLPMQWLVDTQSGGTEDWYLFACAYPLGGGRLLFEAQGPGMKAAWSVWDRPLKDSGFALKSEIWQGTNERTIERVWDGVALYTGDQPGELAWGPGPGRSPVTFEFVPESVFERPHENWMRDYNRLLGDRPLTEIVIPGSHDAGCYDMNRSADDVSSKTQDRDVFHQLLAGSRFFDLRAEKNGDGVWQIRHNIAWTNVPLARTISDIRWFLLDHPGEIVIVSLLLDDQKNLDAFTDGRKDAWQNVYNALHQFNVDFYGSNDARGDLNKLTPNILRKMGKNFLLFTWGVTQKWSYTTPDGTQLTVAPWEAHADDGGPADVMDLKGVYKDDSEALAPDILAVYQKYTRKGGGWVLHTNTPYGLPLWESLEHKHWANAPQLAQYFDDGRMGLPLANIVNMDFVGLPVTSGNRQYELTWSVIWSNFR